MHNGERLLKLLLKKKKAQGFNAVAVMQTAG